MYQHILNISILGESEPIQQALNDVEKDEHLDMTLNCGADFDPELVACADIVIFNELADFRAVREVVKPDAILVACLTPEEEKSLPDAEKACLDDIWQAPLTEFRLERRISHLFSEIGSRDSTTFLIGCLDTFINSLPDMVWFKDLEGAHTKVNDYFCEFVGKPREDVESHTHEDIWGIDEASSEFNCHGTDQAAIDSGETVVAEEVVETESGKHLFKTIKTPIRGLEGEILGTVGIAHDITNLFNLNKELDLFIEMMPFPLMICDLDDQVVKANAEFLKFFETSLGKVLDVNWRDWYEEHILHEISPTGEDIYRRFMHGDGRVSFLKMISHEMNDLFGNYQGVIIVFEDVSADKELEYNIWKLANTDALTGIANRQAFYEFAKRINRQSRVNLVYVDLDNFKQVNDVYGHKAGDEALKATAGVLRQVFGGEFPARLGGDEFVVCVKHELELPELEKLAAELVGLLKEKFSESESLSPLSCSVGVLHAGNMAEGMDVLLKKADSAMYAAKKRGKGRYAVYSEGMERE